MTSQFICLDLGKRLYFRNLSLHLADGCRSVLSSFFGHCLPRGLLPCRISARSLRPEPVCTDVFPATRFFDSPESPRVLNVGFCIACTFDNGVSCPTRLKPSSCKLSCRSYRPCADAVASREAEVQNMSWVRLC